MSLIAADDGNRLDSRQEGRLLAMTSAFRADPYLMAQVAEMKTLLGIDDLMGALDLWDGLEEWEQEKVWLAPLYGGVFTTRERERIKDRA